jgi:hypothetical protein
MSEKRKREDDAPKPDYRPGKKKQKQKGGFRVGPANLPDGAYKRKTQEIKRSLIQKAHLRKEYEKAKKHDGLRKEREEIPIPASVRAELDKQKAQPDEDASDGEEEWAGIAEEAAPEPSTAPHPDRQNLMDQAPVDGDNSAEEQPRPRKPRKPKHQPFKREHEAALKRKAEAEERRKAREEAEKQRQQKIEEREKFRKAMAKARTGGKNGQRKLGRESLPLLQKVKRMVGEGSG